MRIVALEISAETVNDVDELMMLQADLRAIDGGYQELGLETPERVIDKLTEIQREIKTRVRGELERRLKAAKARRADLATISEKRRTLDQEIADLEAKLG